MAMPMLGARATWLACLGFGCSAWLQGCEVDEARHQHVGALVSAVRPLPSVATEPPFFDPADRIEQHDSRAGFFRVHYTRSGRHAVPAADSNGDRTPDYVASVADDFDRVLAFYRELGYREPVRDGSVPGEHGGDDRFDVYLLDFPNAGADGQFKPDTGCSSDPCGGYMLLENDFKNKGYASLELAIRLVSSHELFHAVQQAYATGLSGWLSEGSAVWASEAFDAEAGDVERQARAYFERPESSLAEDPVGVDPIIYAGGIFFQLIDERAGRDVLRRMFELLADSGDDWPVALDHALQEQDSSIAEQFSRFVEWNLFTAERADPERAYARGDQLPSVKERAVEPGYRDDAVRVFPLGARYYTLQTDESDSVIARAALPDDASSDTLQLTVAIERAGTINSIEHASPGPLRELEVPVQADDIAHIILFNAANAGNSARPDLCITSKSRKSLCDQPAGSVSVADAGEPETIATETESGCAVLAPRAQRRSRWLLPLGAIAALVLRQRRRMAL